MGRRELLWWLRMAVKASQQFSAVPPAACVVENRWRWSPEEAGDCRRSKSHHGTGAMDCCPAELASVPDTATQLQCDAGQVTSCQISRGWLWCGYPLLSGCPIYPPVRGCSLRPRRVIFDMNWFPDPICRTGPQTASPQRWEGMGSGDRGASYWSWHCSQSPCMGEPQPTCKRDWTLATASGLCALNIKCCSMLETVKIQVLAILYQVYKILWLCTSSTQPLIYKIHNIHCSAVKTNLLMFLKQLDMLSCWMPWTQKGF